MSEYRIACREHCNDSMTGLIGMVWYENLLLKFTITITLQFNI